MLPAPTSLNWACINDCSPRACGNVCKEYTTACASCTGDRESSRPTQWNANSTLKRKHRSDVGRAAPSAHGPCIGGGPLVPVASVARSAPRPVQAWPEDDLRQDKGQHGPRTRTSRSDVGSAATISQWGMRQRRPPGTHDLRGTEYATRLAECGWVGWWWWWGRPGRDTRWE